MRESELLSHIYARSKDLGESVPVGPGDDAAVVRLGGATLILTTDQLVEGRHYAPETPIDLIARKAVARSVSDIAAMAGRPAFGLAAGTLNREFEHADELFDAMARWATHLGCPLVGGDIAIADGPTVLSVMIIGEPHPSRPPVLRSQARPGDVVCVTGRLGGSLDSGRHLRFEPRIDEALWLSDELGDRLGAMIDLSDGLGVDGGRVAVASGVRLRLESERLPLHPGVENWRNGLSDGEDYELCFTVRGDPPTKCPSGVEVTVVGCVTEGEGCIVVTPEGEQLDAASMGWDHAS